MIKLAPQHIRLHTRASNKEEAIRSAGQVLVDCGAIAPGYVDSMLGRERQANTYLSHGIAIPHGMPQDRELIHRTSISVVQVPEGVLWNDGQTVRLIVGIAARSDEHLSILAALTDILDDAGEADRLATTNDPEDIIAALSRQAPSSGTAAGLSGAEEIEVTMVCSAGLHARPATCFVDVAAKFAADILVIHGEKTANGKAMASLLRLGIPGGTKIRIQAAGPDAKEALSALAEAVAAGLGDEEEGAESSSNLDEGPAWAAQSYGRVITGVSASPGLAIGRLHIFQPTRLHFSDAAQNVDQEKRALLGALDAAQLQLDEIHHAVTARCGKSKAAIFHAHQALLQDEELISEVQAKIHSGRSAAWAWQHSIGARVAEMRALEDERIAARAVDLHDVGQRVLRLLAGSDHDTVLPEGGPVILIADDLTPSDTARLDPARVLGLCTASGGPTSHTAIIARSLDIPAVVGAGPAVLEQTSGLMCILDGSTGQLYIEPSAQDMESARTFQQDLQSRREDEMTTRYQPAMLTDGHRVEVVANIGKVTEAAAAVEAGAEGIGLLRTEFFFLDRETAPTEEEQYEAYRAMVEALNGLPLIVRTLDIGGDKVLPYLPLPKEENPFLGVRGIRLCLRKPEIFIPQLRAIYRASVHGPVKIMFPMIATLEDLRAAREMAEQVRQELGVAPVEIGIMVEVPAAVMMAHELAKETDFFSIGTNDLTQYVLAMDRMHPALAKQVDGLHPAVLRMVDLTVQAASRAGKWVGVCGGVAGDPLGAAILTGLGVRELSMAIPSVAAVKAKLRKLSLGAAQKLARRALACASADEVRSLGGTTKG